MTVYIARKAKPNRNGWMPNFHPALKFGKLQYVFDHDECTNDLILLKSQAFVRLKKFDGEKDFICWPNSGDPLTFIAIICALVKHKHSKFKFLHYNRAKDQFNFRTESIGFYKSVVFKL